MCIGIFSWGVIFGGVFGFRFFFVCFRVFLGREIFVDVRVGDVGLVFILVLCSRGILRSFFFLGSRIFSCERGVWF